MYCEAAGAAIVGVVVNHGDAEVCVAPVAHEGSAPCDDDFGEVVAQGNVGVAEGEGGVAKDDEGRDGGNVEQPALRGDVVVGVACAEADVGGGEAHGLLPVEGGALPHGGGGEEEAACGAPLQVALRECGGVGEAAVVEGVEGVEVQRAHGEHAVGELDALHALHAFLVVPAGEVLGALVDDVEAEAAAVAVEVELVVAVSPCELGGVEGCAEREPEVADADADGGLEVGVHGGLEVLAVGVRGECRCGAVDAFGLDACAGDVEARGECPLRRWARDVGAIDVACRIALRQDAVEAVQAQLRPCRHG